VKSLDIIAMAVTVLDQQTVLQQGLQSVDTATQE
jgi:hypothetical protein